MTQLLFVLLAIYLGTLNKDQLPDAGEVLQKSIEFHDPGKNWSSLKAKFVFNETRPGGVDRRTVAEIDNSSGWFKLERTGIEAHGMKIDSCFLIYGEVDCSRAEVMRNYYLYLWGLPMKLLDKGTPLEEQVMEETFDGEPCFVLRVPYEKDTWYFYFSQSNYQLVAYKFYQDEASGRGELITTEGLFESQGVKFPNNRTWYDLPENEVLGTDIVLEITSLGP